MLYRFVHASSPAVLVATLAFPLCIGCSSILGIEGDYLEYDPSDGGVEPRFRSTDDAASGGFRPGDSSDAGVSTPEPRPDSSARPVPVPNPGVPRDASDDRASGSDDGSATDARRDTEPDTGPAPPSDGSTPDPVVTCEAPTRCSAAQEIGTISGDVSGRPLSVTGYQSAWLKVWVTEDDMGLLLRLLRIDVVLASPPGMNFDLYLYYPASISASPGAVECSRYLGSSASSGGQDSSFVWWPDTLLGGGDDSRYVTIEVRHKSGKCDPNARWTLTVE